MPPLPAVATLPTLSTERRAHVLDTLFEPSTQLHTLSITTLHDTAFSSYGSLISAIRQQLSALLESASSSDSDWLDAILSAHPRLGEKKVESELSRGEQAALDGGEDETEQLAKLNRVYETTFPGLRYVVFVNGRSRHIIMEDMRWRITRNDLKQEKADAVQAMCDIALDRVNKVGEEPET